MKTLNIYGEVPNSVHQSLMKALDTIEEEKCCKPARAKRFRLGAVLAAAAVSLSVVTLGAAGFHFNYRWNDKNGMAYTFEIDYDLKPGSFEVTPGYLPDGYSEDGNSGKYYSENNYGHGISLFLYNTVTLDKWDGVISKGLPVENVEKTVLSGMEAHIVTYRKAEKYLYSTDIYLFCPEDGYVIRVNGDFSVPHDELVKFADHLSVTKLGDDAYESEQERLNRKAEEAQQAEADEKMWREYEEQRKQGIPEDALIPVGQELVSGGIGYTVTDFEFTDGVGDLDMAGFFPQCGIENWLNPDGTLIPYTRIHYVPDENGSLQPAEEEKTDQLVLKVKLTAKCYEIPADGVPLDASICYTSLTNGGKITWEDSSSGDYRPLPTENYRLQIDDSCIWLSAPGTAGSVKRFFWRDMQKGDEIQYELAFVVDKDRAERLLLEMNGAGNNPWNGSDYICGYFMLK